MESGWGLDRLGQVPQLDANSTTDSITLYYNNPTAPAAQNKAGVWSNGYAAVWHLDSNLLDSTANANNAIDHGTTGGIGQRVEHVIDRQLLRH